MYIGAIPTPAATESRQEFTATANQTVFSTTGGTVGYCDCYLNGVKMANSDFSFDGADVTLTTGAAAGDTLAVVMRQADNALVSLPLKDSGGNNVLSESNNVVTLNADDIGTVTSGTFNGTLGTNCDSNFQKINNDYGIQRYFSSITLQNSTWTKLVDVDDVISGYNHSFNFASSRFIATTHVFCENPGSGLIWWGVEAQNNTPFVETAFWRSASGYSVSFRTVYNSATSIELQMINHTGYGPFNVNSVTEFWYYNY